MKKYWFYLEPFTFLFQNKEEFLLYNSVSFNCKVFKSTSSLKGIVSRLIEIRNMYCVELTEEEIKDKDVKKFLNYVCKSFSGDLINSDSIKRPIIFPPIPKLQFSFNTLEKASYRNFGEEILEILKEVNIYIGGKNPKSNLNDIEVFKQFDYCNKPDGKYLSILDLKGIIKSLKAFHHPNLSIIGGNIFTYPYFDELIGYLQEISGTKFLYSFYSDIPLDSRLYPFLEDSKFHMKVLIDFPVDFQILEMIINSLFESNINFDFLFAITSISDYNNAIMIIEKFKIKQYEIKPIFTEKNIGFFKKYVYLTKKDLHETQLSRNQIFLNQLINTNNFGRLRIMNNRKVYSGLSNLSLGSINEPLRNLINREMEKQYSWLKIRNQKPCRNCLYRWICPSPSSYELALRKPNLCHLVE